MTVQLLITAGRGPDECHLVVPRLAAILTAEATAAGLSVAPGTTVAGFRRDAARSTVLVVIGQGASAWATRNAGPVRWIAASPLRPRHARRNWFVQVAMIEGGGDPLRFDESDVTYRAVRSGGPGGQRRNKVATAVRAEHVPSGRIVLASSERTLSANRAAALARLAALAEKAHEDQRRRTGQQRWEHHDQVERGNPTRTVRGPLR